MKYLILWQWISAKVTWAADINPIRPCLHRCQEALKESIVVRAVLLGYLSNYLICCPQVDLVLLPALTGDFGVMPGHVPTIAQLRPGVVTVHKTLDKDIDRYFVSSGFAFVHADSSADVCAIEAVKLDDLDPEAVRSGLQVIPQSYGCNQRCRAIFFRLSLLQGK